MKKLLLLLVLDVFIYFVFPSKASVAKVPTRAVVVFNHSISNAHETAILEAYQAAVVTYYKYIPAVTAYLPAGEIQSIKKDPSVRSVNLDDPIKPKGKKQNIPSYTWYYNDINIYPSWSKQYTGAGVKIAVIDSGIDMHHPDLKLAGGISFAPYSSSYDDDDGHGTHVAGIIAGQGKEDGMEGIAPGSKLYAVKYLNQAGDGGISELLQSIEWCIDHHMDIINMSFVFDNDILPIHEEMNAAYHHGILLVAAAGNGGADSHVMYPAAYSSVIAVSAVNNDNHISSFSSRGKAIEFAAPGFQIYSTYYHHSYAVLNGTSMAAAFVTGVLALIEEANPSFSAEEVRSYAEKHAFDLGETGRDSLYGYGLIQIP